MEKRFTIAVQGNIYRYCRPLRVLYERGLQLLRSGGVLAFITSNKWYRVAYGEKLRKYLKSKVTLEHAIDFGDAQVFDAVAYPTIVIGQKVPPPTKHMLSAMKWNPALSRADLAQFEHIYKTQSQHVAQSDLTDDGWRFLPPHIQKVLDTVRTTGTSLATFVKSKVYRGITTGLNDAFLIDSQTRSRLIAEDSTSLELIRPYAGGRDIDRWCLAAPQEWLVFTRRGTVIDNYPAIKKHLGKRRSELTPGVSGGRKPGSYEWFEIQDNIAYWQEFDLPKIVSTKVSIRPTFAFDTAGYYLGNTSYFFSIDASARYVLGLLNSTVFAFYSKHIFVEKQNGWYEVQPEGLEAFPIPNASGEQKAAIERIVEYILFLHRSGAARGELPNSAGGTLLAGYFEQWVNGLIYELFFPSHSTPPACTFSALPQKQVCLRYLTLLVVNFPSCAICSRNSTSPIMPFAKASSPSIASRKSASSKERHERAASGFVAA